MPSAGSNWTSLLTVPSLSTAHGSELLLAFIAPDYLSGANTTVKSVLGAGLTCVRVTRTNAQNGTSEIWRAFAVSPLSKVAVKATLSQKVVSSMTVLSFSGVDTSGSNGSGAIGATGNGNANPGAPKAQLVTTRACKEERRATESTWSRWRAHATGHVRHPGRLRLRSRRKFKPAP